MAAHAHIPINCMHSHAHTTKQGHMFPCLPKLSHPQTAQTLAPHATCTPAFPTPRRLWEPRWTLHSRSYSPFPSSPACVRGRSCKEARSRQRPARGWPGPRRLPIPAGPTLKAGDQPGRLRGAASPRARCSPSAADSTRDPQETARVPALASAQGTAPQPGSAWTTAWSPDQQYGYPKSCAIVHLLTHDPSPKLSPTPISLAACPLTRDPWDPHCSPR